MTYDLAIIGSSFTGSLLAALARRMGKTVLLLERGQHPRFVIGESSTPLANLLLEELADRHELPWLRPFSKWGTWRAIYPDLPCGLKRGFSFFFHRPGQSWESAPGRDYEMRVAASPNDALADTHWYRPDFDAFLVRQAVNAGVDFVDQIELSPPAGGQGGWQLEGRRSGVSRRFSARYLVDASGPRGFLARSWSLPELNEGSPAVPGGPTQALYTHFRGVHPWDASEAAAVAPFPADDAALHHVFPGGWIWVLRFNNGITSAGGAVTTVLADELRLGEGAPAWGRLLARLPAVAAQFSDAQPVREFVHMPRLSYRSVASTGPGWCLLPGTAGFVDPLLSTGFVLNLLGLERLAGLWARGEEPGDANYGTDTAADLTVTEDLVKALYRVMDCSASFRALSLLYFAAASYSETARRLGRPELAPGFLLRQRPDFAAGFSACVRDAGRVPADHLQASVFRVIEAVNVAGLTTPGKGNWYGCDAADLQAGAAKLGVSRAEIDELLIRLGFRPEG